MKNHVFYLGLVLFVSLVLSFIGLKAFSADNTVLKGSVVQSEGWGYVGIQFWHNDSGRKYIIRVFDFSPAFNAGLMQGDEIIGINGNPIPVNMSNGELASLVQGEPDTSVSIQIRRQSKRYSATLTRKDIRKMPKDFQAEVQ